MSYRRNQDGSSKHEKKDDRPQTSNCKSNCPGRKKRCPGVYDCPYQNNPSSPREDEGETCRTQKNSTVVRVPPCAFSAACPVPIPIIIQAPTESKNPKPDVRIELYIHQLPSTRKNSPDVPQTDESGSLDSDGSKGSAERNKSDRSSTSKESEQRGIAQSSEEMKQSDLEAQILYVTEGEGRINDELRSKRSSNGKSGSDRVSGKNASGQINESLGDSDIVAPIVNLSEVEEIEVESPSYKGESHERTNGNRSSIDERSLQAEQTETDRLGGERQNEETPTSVKTEEEVNENPGVVKAPTEDDPDNQISIDQYDVIIEETVGVEKFAQLQSSLQSSSEQPRYQESNVGSNFYAKVNKATNTEEDANLIQWNSPVKNMVDESTQFEVL